MKLMTGLFVFVAVVVILTAGHAGVARTPGARSAAAGLGDVPEVVVTAERPGGPMPEIVAWAGQMPEVVVRASPAPVELSAFPSRVAVN